jgi:YNFM family putative membrane transporter
MLLGTVIVMLGSAITLFAALPLIILGLLANSFGFFLAHSSASSWVSRNATHAKATASSIYLVFYYLGASAGGVYLNPFWQWHQWPGVVLGSVMILLLSCVLVILLRKRNAPPMRAFKSAEQ